MKDTNYVLQTKDLGTYYGDFKAVTDVNLKIERNKITSSTRATCRRSKP